MMLFSVLFCVAVVVGSVWGYQPPCWRWRSCTPACLPVTRPCLLPPPLPAPTQTVHIHPSSGLSETMPRWLVYHELGALRLLCLLCLLRCAALRCAKLRWAAGRGRLVGCPRVALALDPAHPPPPPPTMPCTQC